MFWLGLLLSLVVGLSLGLLGGGGSTLIVPILVYVLGLDPKVAIAAGLAAVGATSAVGAINHWRAGNIDFRTALLFLPFAMGGTFAGSRLAKLLSGSLQLAILAIVMMAAAALVLRPSAGDSPQTAQQAPTWGRRAMVAGAGVLVGLLTGVAGVGGGFLIVPALAAFAGLSMKRAIGSSLVVIALNSAAGVLSYLDQVTIPWRTVAAVVGLASIGVLGGSELGRRLAPHALRRGFAAFLIVVGAWLLYSNRAAFA